ncbi:hypothetical protein HMPREF3199_00041 [Enterococcus faecium]|nr:hypothetical protein HMPREF3199_00041 [Enterococcus faecium]
MTNKADDLENRRLSVIIFLYQSVGKKEVKEKGWKNIKIL